MKFKLYLSGCFRIKKQRLAKYRIAILLLGILINFKHFTIFNYVSVMKHSNYINDLFK